jgi:hypothetical protein
LAGLGVNDKPLHDGSLCESGAIVVKTPELEYLVAGVPSMPHQHGQGQARFGSRRWIRATCQQTNACKYEGITSFFAVDRSQNLYISSIKLIKDPFFISLLLIFRFLSGFCSGF